MKAFRFVRPRTPDEVDTALAREPGAFLKAGGVDALDRMKERVDTPDVVVGLVDTGGLDGIRLEPDGSVRIGAGETLASIAASQLLATTASSLAHAAGLAASPQIRHRATLGGNLAQHTRCGYYRHRSFPCLKRGGSSCPVLEEGGVQDTAGIFDNAVCASAHPSSVAPVLGSLDAVLLVRSAAGARRVAFADAWRVPEAGTADDLALTPGEWIEAILLPPSAERQGLGYEEVRQKQAFDWALVSAATAITLEADGQTVRAARVWLGSVSVTPRRAPAAEAALVGRPWNDATREAAGVAATEGATPLAGNAYKVTLTRVAVRRALGHAAESLR